MSAATASDVPANAPQVIAAVDLGSNSFHMVVARYADGHLTVIDRLREMVLFAAGLDDRGRVDKAAAERAFDCLNRFGQRLRDIHADNVRAVGTNTFRRAKNAEAFLTQAEEALGHSIEIISGREEARLIYLGAAHTTPGEDDRRLVVDIGGGSTELIVGEALEPLHLVSLYMGCVGISQEYFAGGKFSVKRLRRARLAARMELEPVVAGLRALGWERVFGTSGTISATETILRELGWVHDGIERDAIERLAKKIVDRGSVSNLNFAGLSPQRAPVYLGGLVILLGVFEALGLERMRISDGALRDGLLYDLLGRLTNEDARVRTVRALQSRYHLDRDQAKRVEAVAMHFLDQVRACWKLSDPRIASSLQWAARLHEIGLAIAHAAYHKHGAYLLENADLAGFSRQEQAVLARLVRNHRRKIPPDPFEGTGAVRGWLPHATAILRLAVLLNRGRSPLQLPPLELKASKRRLALRFPDGWLDEHPLTLADLELEADYLRALNLELMFS